MRLIIGADHAGFDLKEKLKSWLVRKGNKVSDLGSHSIIPNDDYPDIAEKVGKLAVSTKTKGILICGSATGVCISANKIKGIRAVAPTNALVAKLSRQDENANILCLAGGKIRSAPKGLGMSLAKAQQITQAWLNTPFGNKARYVRRINKINRLER
ncbi:MAG: RpiB/LacA/LacB family sugar-phosphate isomerase [Candidatus Woesearchaeota archaeon]|nr:RpiB/LacA/LacB family sugar-phosphate isomerase [Candidatus Woesearchaeota archaeon]